MTAGHRLLRAAVAIKTWDLESRDRQRQRFLRDVEHPREGRRRRTKLGHVFIGHYHDFAALQRLRHDQAGVRRMRERGAGVELRHQLRFGHVGDVENEETVMPVTDIKTVSDPERMMAARGYSVAPGIVLAAGFPLAWDPPAADLHRICWVEKVEDHHDVADITRHGRR